MILNLSTGSAPHIRHHETTRVLMGDAILMMLFLYGMALYYYGTRTIALLVVSVISAIIADTVCVLISGKKPNPRDLSAIVTGMMLPLLMPATIDFWIVAVAAAFGIIAAKHPFGGVGHNVFNPAAAGFAFAAISFSGKIFAYPVPRTPIPVFEAFEPILGVSPSFTLALGGTPQYDLVEMLLGNYPGPIGCTNILVILTCLLYLISRNTVRWVTPFCFFVTVAVFSFLFPRIGEAGAITTSVRLYSVAYEGMSGMMLFCGVFMLGDPVTTPKRGWSKAAFAVTSGIVVMLFRNYGNVEEAIPFAILFMNATVWGFDMVGERAASFIRRKRFESVSNQEIHEAPQNP